MDVSQEVIILEDDCGTTEGLEVFEIASGPESIEPLKERLIGRYLVEDFCDENGNVLVSKDKLMDDNDAELITSRGVERIKIRSVLNCRARTACAASATAPLWLTASLSPWARPWALSPLSPLANLAPS